MTGPVVIEPGLARPQLWQRLSRRWSGLVVLSALVGSYELFARSQESPYYPTLEAIWTAFIQAGKTGELGDNVLVSMYRVLVGYVIAAVLGVSIGLMIGYVRWAAQTLDPFLQFLRAIPPPAIIPVALLVLGINDTMQISVIVFGVIWPILVNSAHGARNVPRERFETAMVFGFGRRQVLTKMVFRSALPDVFAGLRIGLSLSLILMIVSELVASTNGLGHFILISQRTFAIPEMYAGIVLLALIGILLNKGMLAIERHFLAWHFNEKAGAA